MSAPDNKTPVIMTVPEIEGHLVIWSASEIEGRL